MRLVTLCFALAACNGGAPPPLRIYLARHGQTDWNQERRLQGGSDRPLTELGRAQAAALARLFDGEPLEQVYTSALSRTIETAAALPDALPRTALGDLDERALGRFEGLYLDGRDAAGLDEYRRREGDPADSLDGGESVARHLERVRRATERLRAEHRSGAVLVVGHGGTNALVLRVLLDLSAAQADAIEQANHEIYAVELAAGRRPRLWKHIGLEQLGEL